jgi:hypothetical protein
MMFKDTAGKKQWARILACSLYALVEAPYLSVLADLIVHTPSCGELAYHKAEVI